jgi:hypothetical protein
MYREIISKIGLGYILEFGQFPNLSLYYMVFDCGFWEIFALFLPTNLKFGHSLQFVYQMYH